jgi:hypothetical protein
MRLVRRLAFGSAVFVALAALFVRRVRPWYSRWGAREDELTLPFPLDDRVLDATIVSTRGITIDAPPDKVWPWVAQIGELPRAGYYSYALIERLQGMRIENAHRIIPEYQSLQVGDVLDKNGTMVVQHVEPGHALVLGPPDSVQTLPCTWAFMLLPDTAGSTRLLTRVRAKVSYRRMLRESPPLAWPFLLLLDPGAFIMERKMLMEIKKHAERGPDHVGTDVDPLPVRVTEIR